MLIMFNSMKLQHYLDIDDPGQLLAGVRSTLDGHSEGPTRLPHLCHVIGLCEIKMVFVLNLCEIHAVTRWFSEMGSLAWIRDPLVKNSRDIFYRYDLDGYSRDCRTRFRGTWSKVKLRNSTEFFLNIFFRFWFLTGAIQYIKWPTLCWEALWSAPLEYLWVNLMRISKLWHLWYS